MKDNALLIKNKDESLILENYLPKNLNYEETKNIIDEILSNNDYTKRDMGKIMKELKERFGMRIDLKLASDYLKNILK